MNKTYTAAELDEVRRLHRDWIDGKTGGIRANLSGAYLSSANLSHANLIGANLIGAYLIGAYLGSADLIGANLGARMIVPETGSFEGYKKLSNGTICRVQIPADAKRTSSLIGRKCRAEYVIVLEGKGGSSHDKKTQYAPGLTVRADSYDDDVRVECSNGIHFFLTKQEASDY